jgi:glucose/arabinose dehydrogenase
MRTSSELLTPRARALLASLLAIPLLAGCERATLPVEAGIGPKPQLPAPNEQRIPTVDIAPARGWSAGEQPTPAAGLAVQAFARDLDHPRWLHVLPNGDVLVAETNAPERPDQRKGLRGFAMKKVMERAGAAVPSADRISLLRDADGDGVAETKTTFASNLYSPFGMALVGDSLYVANSDALVRLRYTEGATQAQGAPEKVVDLPGGTLNHHWTKNVIASPDGTRLFVTVGSNSNVAEHGMEAEDGRAAIWEVRLPGGEHRLYATGLRNPNGMAFTDDGTLWTVVNERDEIGSDLVPDYLTSVKDGGFYGWPYSYFGANVDTRVPPRPELVRTAIVPDYALGAHTASLGLVNAKGNSLPSRFAEGMFVGQHGSWNRRPLSGYKVIFVPFRDGRPEGMPLDVLGAFVGEDGNARGRPVGVALDRTGALLVADDVGNVIWRVSAAR